jgi:hypothetical protein
MCLDGQAQKTDTEIAQAGYYAVTLDDYAIRAEARCRRGISRRNARAFPSTM